MEIPTTTSIYSKEHTTKFKLFMALKKVIQIESIQNKHTKIFKNY